VAGDEGSVADMMDSPVAGESTPYPVRSAVGTDRELPQQEPVTQRPPISPRGAAVTPIAVISTIRVAAE
jgi:hypothetical protein